MKRARKAAWVVAVHAMEAVALVLAGAAIVCALVFWRLSQGPVGLEFMREEVEDALADALNGDVVSIGHVQASWRGRDRSVGIVLADVVVAEAGGGILARAPRLAADLSFPALLGGEVAFSRLVVEGGEVSIVRDAAGALSAGLGAPDQVAARAAGRPPGERRSLAVLREAIEAQSQAMRELRLEGAVLYVRDEITGVDWKAENATLRVTRDAAGVRAEASGAIAAGDPPATLRLSARAGPGLRRALFEIELGEAVPARLFPRSGPLGALAGVELPVTASASATVDDAQGLLAADLTVSLGAGRLQALGRELGVRESQVHLIYDPAGDVLTLVDAAIDSDLFAGRLQGRIEGLTDRLLGSSDDPLPVKLAAEHLTADLRPIFPAPLDATSIAVTGAIEPEARRLVFTSLEARIRGVEGSFAGDARLERVSDGRLLPSVKIAGDIAGRATVKDVLDYFPFGLADSAREWIAGSVKAGRVSKARLDLDLPAEALVVEMLEDDRLTLTFDFADARTVFLSTMSPLTQLNGTAVLRGNSFELELDSGELAGLALESGYVDIPYLIPKGAPARFGGVARGRAEQVLAFIDQPPLLLPSSYGMDPAAIAGEGTVEFEITRPMLTDVPVEDMGFDVKGAFAKVRAPTMLPGIAITDADLTLRATPDGLEARAEGGFGPAPATIEWRETFKEDEEGGSTRFHIETTVDAAAFDALGVPVRRFFTGAAGLVVDAQGRGLDISRASIAADLTAAGLTLPEAAWSKEAGAPASARIALQRRADGALDVTEAALDAPGAELQGKMTLAADGRLEALSLTPLKIDRFVDVTAQVSRGRDGEFIATARGGFADVRGVVRQMALGGGEPMGAPLDLEVKLDRAVVADGVSLENLSLRLDHDGEHVRWLDFSATGEGGPLTARIEPPSGPEGARRFNLSAADAGEAVYVMLGVNTVRGGTLRVRADLPPLGAPEGTPTSAILRAEDFTLVGAPALAQVLTLASLEGLANTLNGEGIRFSRLRAPIKLVDGQVTIEEAQAAGQALGVTVNGVIDLDAKTLDIEGVLVPAYSVNSALGNMPVVGNIFVSRRGEGVFALTYNIDGPFEATRVFVNPLSVIAPGLLRRIFEPVAEDVAEAEGAPG